MSFVDTNGAPLIVDADIDYPDPTASPYKYYFANEYTVTYLDAQGKKTGNRIEKWNTRTGVYDPIPTYIQGAQFTIRQGTYCRVIEVEEEFNLFECTFVLPGEDGKTMDKYKLTSSANRILTRYYGGGRRRQRRKTSKTRSRRSRSRRSRSRRSRK